MSAGAADSRWSRRRWLAHGCAHCAAFAGLSAAAAETAPYDLPPRLSKPDLSTDEGGLWALMDREETKLRRGPFMMRDAALQAYVDRMVCKLGAEHCNDARAYVVRTPMFNAMMAPNGMMQIWSGLLLRVENEAQLAAVVGHELGHYLRRHSLDRLRDARTRTAFMTLMAPFGLIGLVGQLAALGGGMAYSRDHEREADRIGLALMQRGGYDPRQASVVWRNLRAELAAGPGGDPANRSVLFASHPGIDERESVLEQMAAGGTGALGEAEHRAATDPWLVSMLDDEVNRAQYDETIVLFERLSRLRPQHGVLRSYLGEARRLRGKEGDVPQAEVDLQAALTLDAPPAVTHRSLGLLARSQGRKADADAAFERYLKALPDATDAGLIRSYVEGVKTP